MKVTIKPRDNTIRPELGWFVHVQAKAGGISTCVGSEEEACAKAAEWMLKKSRCEVMVQYQNPNGERE